MNPKIIFSITWQNSQLIAMIRVLLNFTSGKVVLVLWGTGGVSLLMIVRWSITSFPRM